MSFDQGHTSKKWQSKDSNGRPVLFRATGPPQTLHNLIFYHLHFLSARASQRPGRNHTKIPLPASECPYFPQEPELQGGQGEGRPHGSAVPSSQPACGEESRREVWEAEVSGRSIGPHCLWAVTAQGPSDIGGTKPRPQCPRLCRALSPEPSAGCLAEHFL